MSNKPEYSIFDPAKIPREEISDANALVKEPVVSACMITYNHAPYIAQAIEGVLQQITNFPFELIIGEDCSTDATRDIVLEYQKKYPNIIRVITSDHNVGATKNSYRTEQACRGKYIAYCEGDDYWHHPQKLQMQADYLEAHPECGLVCTDVDVFYQSSGKFNRNVLHDKNSQFIFPDDPIDVFLAIVEWQFFPRTCTVMLSKEHIDRIKAADPELYYSDRFLMGDTQTFAEIALIGKIHFIDRSLAVYRVLKESATQSKNLVKKMRFVMSSNDMNVYLLKKHNVNIEIIKRHEIKYWQSALRYGSLTHQPGLIMSAAEKIPKLLIIERLLAIGKHGLTISKLTNSTYLAIRRMNNFFEWLCCASKE